MICVLSLALLFATFTNSSLTAAIGALVVFIVMNILGAFSYFDFLKPYLFTSHMDAWQNLLSQPIVVAPHRHRRCITFAIYIVALMAAAWYRVPAQGHPRVSTVYAQQSWRLGLVPEDRRDAVELALSHHRLDLFYGAHYLRFSRTHDRDGSVRLALRERARLVTRGAGPAELVDGPALPTPFALEESVPGAAAKVDERRATRRAARRFLRQAAHLLDELDGR